MSNSLINKPTLSKMTNREEIDRYFQDQAHFQLTKKKLETIDNFNGIFDFLNKIGCQFFKIGSGDTNNLELIEYVSKLDDKDFKKIKHLLKPNLDIEMNDIVRFLHPRLINKSSSKKVLSQIVDDEVLATFKLKKQIPELKKKQIIKDLKKLQRKYSSLINLDVEELDNIIEHESETLKDQYSSKRKLKLKSK